MAQPDVAIVGAGPSGIASALCAKDAGLRPVLIDRAGGLAYMGREARRAARAIAREVAAVP